VNPLGLLLDGGKVLRLRRSVILSVGGRSGPPESKDRYSQQRVLRVKEAFDCVRTLRVLTSLRMTRSVCERRDEE
jgi:hypothetical protein